MNRQEKKSSALLALAIAIIVVGIFLLPNPSKESDAPEEEFEVEEPFVGLAAAAPSYVEEKLAIGSATVSFLSSHPFSKKNDKITRLVISIHGMTRKADAAYNALAPVVLDGKTLLIAPRFPIEEEALQGQLYWTESGWKRGHNSIGGSVVRYSSYEVIDRLVKQAAETFPLKQVIIAGHSAGGQFVQRYAAGNPTENQLKDLSWKYVVANPSSYLYLNSFRWNEKKKAFAPLLPKEIENCPDYNDYHKGLQNLNNYMKNTGKTAIIKNLINRNIVYLSGDQDIDEHDEGLDTSCSAELQGATRFERNRFYLMHLDFFFPKHNSETVAVPGVGHSARKMFQSAEGKEVLG